MNLVATATTRATTLIASAFIAGAGALWRAISSTKSAPTGGQVLLSCGFALLASGGIGALLRRLERRRRRDLLFHTVRTTLLRLEDICDAAARAEGGDPGSRVPYPPFADVAEQLLSRTGRGPEVDALANDVRRPIDAIRTVLVLRIAEYGGDEETIGRLWRIEDLFRHFEQMPAWERAADLIDHVAQLHRRLDEDYGKDIKEWEQRWL
jgi:hypothetical protein